MRVDIEKPSNYKALYFVKDKSKFIKFKTIDRGAS